ncbi:MAG TPA: hypothetical protein VH092_34695 [Urbifossiella sp.]|jgi:hypothetical protein|nr:hypothetical protein [Urbifossiella sp.]
MELNAELLAAIRVHFAGKPSADLRAILEARDTTTLSDEAFATAEAVLAERARGEAAEPGPAAAGNEPPAGLWSDHPLAWGLVWALRVFALLAAISGSASWLAAVTSHGAGREALLVAAQAVCAVVGPLVLAEGLRLGILIERNTRRLAPPAGGEVVTRANGGSIFQSRGTDTVPAMLTPGEYVINAASARANSGLLHRINTAKGPVQYHDDGGWVSKGVNA